MDNHPAWFRGDSQRTHNQTHNGLTMDTQRTHHGLTMDSLWTHYGLTMDSQQTHNGLTMDSQWIHNRLTTDSQWTHNGFTKDSQWIHTKIIEKALVLLGCPRKGCFYIGFIRLSVKRVVFTLVL